MRAVAACAATVLVAACAAQTGERANGPETFARDLHEEVTHIDVTLTDRNGKTETHAMPITIYRPDGPGPFPLVVFNHGRAPTEKRATQGRAHPEAFARYFVDRGFVVLVPTRVGYWETYDVFDPEDTNNCFDLRPEAMARATSDEVLATVAYARTLAYVDTRRWIVAGVSVGGLATIATVGRRPEGLVAGLNFSGGAGGNPVNRPGRSCGVDRIAALYARSAHDGDAPIEWFYWANDQYWGESAPRAWFAAWRKAGGRGEFNAFPAKGEDGHAGVGIDMDHWVPVVDRFVADLGFPKPAVATRPPASGYAAVGDVERVPVRGVAAREAYRKFLAATAPRAFAIGDDGGFGYAIGDYVIARALGFCRRGGQHCRLYAVDDEVVW